MKEAIITKLPDGSYLIEGTTTEINNYLSQLPQGVAPVLVEIVEKGGDGLNNIIALHVVFTEVF